MLFTYSPSGLQENWLNDTIISIVSSGMDAIAEGNAPTEWPDCIPLGKRAALQTRTGIRDRLITLYQSFGALEPDVRAQLQQAMLRQTALPEVLTDGLECVSITDFPKEVKVAVRSLFDFLFELLSELQVDGKCIRDIQYSAIYAELKDRICPFCGLGYFRGPGAPRHNLDHYMPISRYPFAGADLRNLPPICSECNSDFKGATDILYDAQGIRRMCSDPYNGPTYTISLAGSRLFEGESLKGIQYPQWVIGFLGPTQAQAATWDEIYKIRDRYIRDVLTPDFLPWLRHFAKWYVGAKGYDHDGQTIASSIPEYIELVIQDGWADRAFLKAQVFLLVSQECEDNERGETTRAWLRDVVEIVGAV
ncbi:hypothetical protein ACO34A_15635 [Rhizobium sp. ACO-34A]|nr:hypothetical protein [Rhizobium sp. ACO-34A]ATN35234.1 hypothetical protein ACO34A_15635 [Rhizobium sp. ACO-34A]